jgi:Fe2+ transport system protein FeoA
MQQESDIVELLEIVKVFTLNGRAVPLDQIPARMSRLPEEVQRLAQAAIDRGLAYQTEAGIRLTERGEALIKKHREEYLHETHVHGRSLTGRLKRLLERDMADWHEHWRHHGLDDESLPSFYKNMDSLQGRVEDTVVLTDLREGEKSTMVLAFGGHRMVRRLAEMGLTPGTEVTVVRSAPMHGPIEISVRGVSLALGRGIANRVLVKRATDSHPHNI